MSSYFCIRLEALNFFSKIGVFEEERRVGNKFVVDISVMLSAEDFIEEDLSTTANYAAIYDIVKNVMGEELLLLETAASIIAKKIRIEFPASGDIKVKITKVNPPIPGIRGSASVEFINHVN